MPKALITGATGLLGRAVLGAFHAAGWKVTGTGLARAYGYDIVKLDLLDQVSVKALIEKERPDFILHSAADRSPDSVAANPERARQLNVEATSRLARIASSLSIPVLYISTDYVFPGVPGEAPYSESSTPRATNLYGQLKLDGETAVLEASSLLNGVPLGAVMRLPVLYGRVDESVGNKESAVNVLVDKVREAAVGKKVVMDDWAKRYPTNVDDIGRAIVQIGEKWLHALAGDAGAQGSGGDFPRIMHFSAKECYTKFEMCRMFADILAADMNAMERDITGGAGSGVQRPYDTKLATGELERVLGKDLDTVSFKEWWKRELEL